MYSSQMYSLGQDVNLVSVIEDGLRFVSLDVSGTRLPLSAGHMTQESVADVLTMGKVCKIRQGLIGAAHPNSCPIGEEGMANQIESYGRWKLLERLAGECSCMYDEGRVEAVLYANVAGIAAQGAEEIRGKVAGKKKMIEADLEQAVLDAEHLIARETG